VAVEQAAEAAPRFTFWADLIKDVAVNNNKGHAVSGKYKM
jgi:hypothetical protein